MTAAQTKRFVRFRTVGDAVLSALGGIGVIDGSVDRLGKSEAWRDRMKLRRLQADVGEMVIAAAAK